MYSTSTPPPQQTLADFSFMETIPLKPELSKSICLEDSKSLQAFLKLSRYAIDDNLKPNLNNFLNHNEKNDQSVFKFNKSLESMKTNSCLPILNVLIYPEWKKRLDVIRYCQSELNKVHEEVNLEDDGFSSLSLEEKNNLLRIDPYTYKNLEQKSKQKNAKIIELKNFYNNEEQIENIVQNRSVELLNETCKLNHLNISNGFLDYVKSTTASSPTPSSPPASSLP